MLRFFFAIFISIFVLIQVSCAGKAQEVKNDFIIFSIEKDLKDEKFEDLSEVVGEIYLSAENPKNPLSVFRLPITKEVVRMAEEILHGEEGLTSHQKIVRFMNYMNDFKVGIGSDAKPETTLRERIGACGTFTNVLLALAATQGIQGRYINLMNYPLNYGHTVAEFWIDGNWRVYDPTYAAYYTDTPGDVRNPNVLSFEELRAGKGRDPKVVKVIGNNHRLEEGKPFSYGFLGPEIYEEANPAGSIGPDKPFIFPLTLDFKEKSTLEKEEFGTNNQGANYIGSAGINNNQEWILTSLTPGKKYVFVVVPDGLCGEMLGVEPDFRSFAGILSGGEIIEGDTVSFPTKNIKLDPWEVRFVANNDTVRLLIQHPYRGPKFHYMIISKYYLKEM